jgi:Undecaprenyl-phosphate glucose phosphotransferase
VVVTELQYVPERDTDAAIGSARRLRGIAAGAPAPLSPVVVRGMARATEFLIIALAGLNAYYLYVAGREIAMAGAYWTVSFGAAAATVAAFELSGLYSIPAFRGYVPRAGRMVAIWTGIAGLLMAIAFFTRFGADFSRVWMAMWFVSATALLVAARVAASIMVRAWTGTGRLTRRGVIIGGGARAGELISALAACDDSDLEICGIFDDRAGDRSPAMIAGCPKLGNIEALLEFARSARVDLLIVSLPLAAEARVMQLLRQLWVLPVDIRLSAHASRLRFRPRTYSYIGAVPFLDVFDRPLRDWSLIVKRIEDVVIAAILVVLLAPLMGLVALAVKLDSPGPVLFRQPRHGFNDDEIEILKFRSLYADACDPEARRLVYRGDPRVTRVGRFIRRTSLDELPQLFNVLRGELSLVGPRPHAPFAATHNRPYADVVESYSARHRVKPGITGWAQINGWRGATDNEQQIRRRVEHDLHYIENWSLAFDLYILAMTPFTLFNNERAF